MASRLENGGKTMAYIKVDIVGTMTVNEITDLINKINLIKMDRFINITSRLIIDD